MGLRSLAGKISQKRWQLISLGITLAALLAVGLFPRWTVDDAYIYYRYAENWAQFGSPTWNIGQPPVEGYTGIGLLAALAAGIKLGISPISLSHNIGIASYIGSLFLVVAIAAALGMSWRGRALALGLYISSVVLFTHAWSGLETMLFLFSLLLSLWLFIKALQSPRRRIFYEILFIIEALAVSLVRPEGIVWSATIFLFYCISYVKEKKWKQSARFIIQAMLLYALPFGLYYLWRYDYYGTLLPNTFYVKTVSSLSLVTAMEAARFLLRYFGAPMVVALIWCLVEADQLALYWRSKQSSIKWWSMLYSGGAMASFCALLLLQYSRSHLTMNYAYRFYIPFLPLFWFGLAFLIDQGVETLERAAPHKTIRSRLLIIVSFLLVIYQLVFAGLKFKEEWLFASNEQAMLAAEHIAVGNFLRSVLPSHEWLVVYIDAGAIPYFSKLKTVDFGGLNDAALARGQLSAAERVNYLFAHNPGAIVITSTEADKLSYGEEPEAIIKDARFIKNYSLAQKFLAPPSIKQNYHEFVYIRNDLADKPQK